MKKGLLLIIVTLILGGAIMGAEQGKLAIYRAATDHYAVYSAVSKEHAEDTAKKMEAFASLFNSYFHFDLTSMEAPMTMRIFSKKDDFNEYLRSIISEEKDNFVFLQYSDPSKSELVGFVQPEDQFELSLVRHGFIQFLKTFIPEPPLWLQRGFTLYLEKSTYDEENEYAVHNENMAWLNTLKNFIASTKESSAGELPPITLLLQPDEATASQKVPFYAVSWGLVTFLLESSNNNYNRLMWDTISTLDPWISRSENEKAVVDDVFAWTNQYLFQSDFLSYINSLKTFPELVESGIEEYNQGNMDKSEDLFIEAIVQNGEHYLPYYYLGLINYSKEDYSLAEYYYQSAMILGGDQALTNYALGVNAFADNRLDEAKQYLSQAKEADPGKYASKADKILDRISAQTGVNGG